MSNFKQICLWPSICAVLLAILLPSLQFGVVYNLWSQFHTKVDRGLCQCSCWDTIFKGFFIAGYERGVGSYKHVYFNVTWNTMAIWSVTIIAFIGFYESVKYTLHLLILGQSRGRMLVLFLSSLYPHYYAWWSLFNYFNDDFYEQMSHELFFAFTEIAATIVVLKLVDAHKVILVNHLLFIMGVSCVHVVTSALDQFLFNVVMAEGEMHQVLRDLGLMLPDLLHIFLPFLELRDKAEFRGVPTLHLISDRQFAVTLTSVLAGVIFCKLI